MGLAQLTDLAESLVIPAKEMTTPLSFNTVWPQGNIRLSGEEGDDPPMLVRLRPCYGKDCAEMLRTRGLRIVSTCPRVNKMSTFKC